jgi:hypothetical protein
MVKKTMNGSVRGFMKKLFFVFAFIIMYCTAYCDDIVYIVTQNTGIKQGHSTRQTRAVREGEKVFFQGNIRAVSGTLGLGVRREFEMFIRTERGEEGWIDARHILLQNNQLLSDSTTAKTWIYSYYQEIILEQKRETVFKHEPFWRDQYRDYVRHDFHMSNTPWWVFFHPVCFYFRNNLTSIIPIFVGDYMDFATTKQEQDDAPILLRVICIEKHSMSPQTYQDYLTKFFNEGETYQLLLRIDGDYMDVFVNDNPTKICTLIGVDEYFVRSVANIIRGDEAVNLSRIVWPRRADGSMDYPPPPGVLSNTSRQER